MRALVVTSNPLLCSSLDRLLLATAGASSLSAANAAEARALLTEHRPDLILAAGWLAEGEQVELLVDAGRRLPGVLRIAVEATPAERVLLEAAGVDVVLVQGEPASHLVEALARILPPRPAGGTPAGDGAAADGLPADPAPRPDEVGGPAGP